MSSVAAPACVAEAPSRARLRPLLLLRRAAGVAIAAAAVLPLYRLLPSRETGLAGEGTVAILDVYFDLLGAGALLMIIPALAAGYFLTDRGADWVVERARALLLAPPIHAFAIGLALLAAGATAAFTLLVLEGKPSLIDAMAQLLHARFWAAGRLAGPAGDLNVFWHIQNSLITPHGWVSQYPPGHVALLALGFVAGAPWLVGVLGAGLAVYFTTLAAVRLLPERPASARLCGLLLACSTFFICLSGSYLNHVSSAALAAVALYCAVRARDGRATWAVPVGFTLAFAFAVRPLSAIVAACAFGFGLWFPRSRAGLTQFVSRAALAVAGATPLMAAHFAYNQWFFGSPLRLGYSAALGPSMSLGFHRDPWGNMYGPVEAFLYSSGDILALGVNLLESPLSATLIIGIWLAVAAPLSSGARVFAAWALGSVAANALYWHHGIYMGPRMLLESAPAWAALLAIAATGLFHRVSTVESRSGRLSWRSALLGALTVSAVFGIVYLGPQRARSYGGAWLAMSRTELPRPEGKSLVFVHDSWVSRSVMRLAASGMRLDSVETALRQNSTCRVHRLAVRMPSLTAEQRGREIGRLDMEPRGHTLPEQIMISPGNRIRVTPNETPGRDCMREARADAAGILDIAPFIWQGDLPGVPGEGTLYIRDLGPEANQRALSRWSGREPWVVMMTSHDAEPVLLEYEEGMRRVWQP